MSFMSRKFTTATLSKGLVGALVLIPMLGLAQQQAKSAQAAGGGSQRET